MDFATTPMMRTSTKFPEDLIGIRELLDKMDHAQDALLENGQSLQGQLESLTGQITHMIQVLTQSGANRKDHPSPTFSPAS